jgi:hypothetical protein
VKIALKERSDKRNFHDNSNYQVETVVLQGFTSTLPEPWMAMAILLTLLTSPKAIFQYITAFQN